MCVDILNSRVLKGTFAFKQFLTDHQQVIKKHEEKKDKLKGAVRPPVIMGKKPTPSSAIKGKMKILPAHHYSQVSTNESIESENGGVFAVEMQDTMNQTRVNSIETIEKTLFDITSLFKRFATIVQE